MSSTTFKNKRPYVFIWYITLDVAKIWPVDPSDSLDICSTISTILGRHTSYPSVRLSVSPSRYLLLNHWTKSNQIKFQLQSQFQRFNQTLGVFSHTGLPLNIVFKIPWLFTDFSLTFYRFPDRFRRSILAIFIHRQLENFVQIFMLSDLIFKRKISNHQY